MSDYLGNLLTRSFAAMPAVCPQVPSVFEPVATGVEPAVAPAMETSFEMATRPMPETCILRDELQSQPTSKAELLPSGNPLGTPPDLEIFASPAPSTSPRVKAHISKESPSNGVIKEKLKPVTPEAAPKKRIRENETDTEQRVIGPPAVSNAERAQFNTGTALAKIMSASNRSEEKSPRRGSPPTDAPQPISMEETAAMEQKSESQSKVSGNLSDSTMAMSYRDGGRNAVQPVQPKVTSTSRITPLAPQSSPQSLVPPRSPAPKIQLTIGRLEVRVVQPPLPQRSRPVAPKTLSLDEYMHQRASGGRK